jgi:hypothetical protein
VLKKIIVFQVGIARVLVVLPKDSAVSAACFSKKFNN